MLDRSKLSQELQRVAGTLFVDCSLVIKQARAAWEQIAHDESLFDRLSKVESPLSIPTWTGAIGKKVVNDQKIHKYHILSVDGSQIYPDRHQGPSCFLINIGSIVFHYGSASRVQLY